MFVDFLTFLMVLDLMWPQVCILRVLVFMEYLHNCGMSPSNVTNYMRAIRSMCIVYGQDTSFMIDHSLA